MGLSMRELTPPSTNIQQANISIAEPFLAFFMLICGAILLSQVNESFQAALSVLFVLGVSIIITKILRIPFYEIRVFYLTFIVCVFGAGLAQYYTVENFGSPIATLDSLKFAQLIKNNKINTIKELERYVNAPLAVLFWKYLYKIFYAIGIAGKSWLGVLCNTLIVSVSGIITIRIARIIYPENNKVYLLTGTLYAFCGFSVLFGSLLLRDSFALFFNTIIFLFLVRLLKRITLWRFFQAAVVITISAISMGYIRESSLVLVGFIVLLAFFVWIIGSGLSPIKVIFLIFGAAVVFGLWSYLNEGIGAALSAKDSGAEQYSQGAILFSRKESLGVSLIINQPLIIKAIVAPVYLYIFPIPAWGYFSSDLTAYYVIRSYHSFYAIFVMPFLMFGIYRVIRHLFTSLKENKEEVFLVLYFLSMIVVVSLTTLETRHFGQFYFSSVLICASIRHCSYQQKTPLKTFIFLCYGGIVFIHVLWAIVRYLL